MKTRQGFVSNSSSSSFCIYGLEEPTELDIDEKIEAIKNLGDLIYPHIDYQIEYYEKDLTKHPNEWAAQRVEDNKCIKRISKDPSPEDIETVKSLIEDEYDFYEVIGLDFYSIDGYRYLGKSWSSVGDDETGLEFKESVKAIIGMLDMDDDKCTTHAEAWRD